jgi:hypothetical protein
MYCSFCGNFTQIEKEFKKTKSKIKSKPVLDENVFHAFCFSYEQGRRVEGGIECWTGSRWIFRPDTYHYSLALIERDIETLDEIVCWYSDNELQKIEELDISNNKIISLKGLNRLTLEKLNLSKNDLTIIDYLPKFKYERESDGDILKFKIKYLFELDLSFNVNLKDISDEIIKSFNENYKNSFNKLTINLIGCRNFNFERLSEINFEAINSNGDKSFIKIVTDNNINLKINGFERREINEIINGAVVSVAVWELKKSQNDSFEYNIENTNIFDLSFFKIASVFLGIFGFILAYYWYSDNINNNGKVVAIIFLSQFLFFFFFRKK